MPEKIWSTKMNISEIASACNGRLVGPSSLEIKNIVIDSRRPFSSADSLYVAIVGARHDGHQYIADLYSRGLRAFVVGKSFDVAPFTQASFIVVDNTLTAFQDIALHHRSTSACRVVAITGSNGKTTVKEWLAQLVAGDMVTARSPRSYNSQTGVPLSLLTIEDDTQLAIIEAGISQCGEMEHLSRIVKPNDVIITNIGEAHQENFSSIDEKIAEKIKLCKGAERIVYNIDNDALASALKREYPQAKHITWSSKGTQAYCTVAVADSNNGKNITLDFDDKHLSINTQLTDAASVENIITAALYAAIVGINTAKIASRAAELSNIEMRLEQKEGVNDCLIINDSYNADLTSLSVALDMLHVLGTRRGLTKTLILSDLQQTGLPDAELYHRVKTLIAEKNVDRLIGIGKHISRALAGMPEALFFTSTEQFLGTFSTADFRQEAILLKGSRVFGFERIATMLASARHRTIMEINLNALSHNIAYFRRLLPPTTKLLCMVKAYSYGTGSFEIARLMQQQGVDYLGVAFADEGVELRAAGITLPIIVMNPEEHAFDVMLANHLEPEIYSELVLRRFAEAAKRAGIRNAEVHIKIDTGMHRSGFDFDQADHIADVLSELPNVHVASVFSHLVGADEAIHDDFSREQIARFKAATSRLRERLGYDFIRHILNSAGIERFTQDAMEMVRLGIGLYGVSAIDNSKLKNVATLRSFISLIRTVKAGDSIGYSRKTVVNRESRIAIVPIGYADGLDRRLSNGVGKVMINNKLCPIVGNVCMDLCMVDVTDVPNARESDSVIIFGDQHPVWEVSDAIGTIPYEVLTGIGRRIKRVYYIE